MKAVYVIHCNAPATMHGARRVLCLRADKRRALVEISDLMANEELPAGTYSLFRLPQRAANRCYASSSGVHPYADAFKC